MVLIAVAIRLRRSPGVREQRFHLPTLRWKMGSHETRIDTIILIFDTQQKKLQRSGSDIAFAHA